MVAPVIYLPGTKHSGVSGLDTQLFCQHSGETPLRGGFAESLTRAVNADPKWEASWPSFVDPIARVRMIPWPNSAWTQGIANRIAVGLECAGYARFSKADWLTSEGLKQLENLAHEWVYYWRLEKDAGNTIPLRWLTTAEVQKVLAGNKSIKGFCTHAQIDPNSRTDPGPNFPYAQLLKRIGEIIGGKVTPASTTTKDELDMAGEKEFKQWVREVLKEDPNGDWDYNRKGDKQDASAKLHETQMNVRKLLSLVTAQQAALKVLATDKNVDASVLQKAIDDAVSDLRIVLVAQAEPGTQ
jgi:hypothetical protein